MPPSEYNFKRISDPIYGFVSLSKLETELVSSRIFQRLRNIKHLGLVHYVFPGADFSRFSHSLGACAAMTLILDTFKDNGIKIEESDYRNLRLAALLHDIGHYPFSHPMEEAISNYYAAGQYEPKSDGGGKKDTNIGAEKSYIKHEAVGEIIISSDEDIVSILRGNNIDPNEIVSFVKKGNSLPLAKLVSSDLDADRIDYLLRTAHHTGLPYGAIDFKYLISQARKNADESIHFTSKAVGAIDQFLLSRYFAYQQVSFHKTVIAFEYILGEALKILLDSRKIDCSKHSVMNMVKDGSWCEFDDNKILSQIRVIKDSSPDKNERLIAESILYRRPPTLVAGHECLYKREKKNDFNLRHRHVSEKIKKWAEDFGIDEKLWFIRKNPGLVLTSIGSQISIPSSIKEKSDTGADYLQSVQIISSTGESKSVVEVESSLMSILSNYAFSSLKVYVLIPHDKRATDPDIKRKISDKIRKDVPEVSWT